MPRPAPSASPGSISAPWPGRAEAGSGSPLAGARKPALPQPASRRRPPAGPPAPSRCGGSCLWMWRWLCLLIASGTRVETQEPERWLIGEPVGPPRSEPLVLKIKKPRPREGATFPRSHSKRAAEVPQEPALCAPCSAMPLTHGESGTLASGYTHEYRGGGSPFALKPEVSLSLPLPTPGGPLRRPGLSWRWGTPETRPGTAGLNEAWGTVTHLSCCRGGGPGMRPQPRTAPQHLGVGGPSGPGSVPVSQMGTWTTGRKGSQGQAVEVSLSPPLRPTS